MEPLEPRIAPAAVIYFSEDNTGKLYQIDPGTGTTTFIGASGTTARTAGLTETADPFVFLGSDPFGLVHINGDGSGDTLVGTDAIEGLAFAHDTGKLYAALNGSLFTVNPATGAKITDLAGTPNGKDAEGLAWGGPGVLFALATHGDLLRYDIAGNSWSTVANTGIDFDNAALAYDPATQMLYAKGKQDNSLYKINPVTAAATAIGTTGLSAGGGLALIDNTLAIAPGGKSATYTDGNGDLVTVKLTQGALKPANFTLLPAPPSGTSAVSLGFDLAVLNLSAAEFKDTNVTFNAKKTKSGGDGFAHVGYLNAMGHDLGTVLIPGDLGELDAGDNNATLPAIKSLTVNSIGLLDLAHTIRPGLPIIATAGDLGSLTVKGDVQTALLNVQGSLGPLTIAGSLIGGDADFSAQLVADKIGSVTIGGSIVGGTKVSAGNIFATGTIGPVKIGGSIFGGSGSFGGQIFATGAITSVTIAGSIYGGEASHDGSISTSAALGPVKIGGSIVGGAGIDTGLVSSSTGSTSLTLGGSLLGGEGLGSGRFVAPAMGAVKIGGSIVGGGNTGAGALKSGSVQSLTLGSSLLGGAGQESGRIEAAALGAVKIGGSIVGGSNTGAGVLNAVSVQSLSLGGDLRGGGGTGSGAVFIDGHLGATTIRGSVIGGVGVTSGYLNSNTASAGVSGPVTIGGDIRGGSNVSALVWAQNGSWAAVTVKGSLIGGNTGFSGGILAGENLGPIKISGSIVGTSTDAVTIRAGGSLIVAAGATTNVAIASLQVGGSVSNLRVLAGYGINDSPINGGVQIGRVTVGGNWSASSITAGFTGGTDGDFDTADDLLVGAGATTITSRIASIVIKGVVTGTARAGDHFGFIAQQIGSFSAGGWTPKLTAAGADTLELATTGDVTLRDQAM